MPNFKEYNPIYRMHSEQSLNFEELFVKMYNNVKYFQIFCNLSEIVHDVPAAATVIIQIRGFFN